MTVKIIIAPITKLLSVMLLTLTLVCTAVGDESRRPNVLLICVDDLRPELGCYGVPYIHSPNIDRLATRGRLFRRHYVQAPTCGASRYTLLTGRYGGRGNGALFDRAKNLLAKPESVSPSMPAWFREHGYTTVSVGKVSHHPGGRGGNRWDDATILEMPDSWDRHLLHAGPWKDPRGWMHGLADGEVRSVSRAGSVEMKLFQSAEGNDSSYPDGGSIEQGLEQIEQLAADKEKPFFLAVGILRPHLPFGAPIQYFENYANADLPHTPHPEKPSGRTTWHGSGEFMKYNRGGRNPNQDAEFALEVRKHYAACVSYADAQVGKLLSKLQQTGVDEQTIVVLWGDHGWHLGEHAIWGKHTLFEESLRSPLIVSHPNIEHPGVSSDAVVETLDVFPTLCELAMLPMPEFAQGTSLGPLLTQAASAGQVAVSYTPKARSIRTERYRLIVHDDGFVELYDHESPKQETHNIAADHPEIVQELSAQLTQRLASPANN